MNKVYLGLGTNMGDRLLNLKRAVEYLESFEGIRIVKLSKVYETKAWGYTDQDDFLNMCLEVETDIDKHEVLQICQEVEQRLHRKRIIRWGPRTIDVDILFYNDFVSDDEELILPHPRIKQRAFVIIPLLDLDEDIMLKGKKLRHYLDLLPGVDIEGVKDKGVLINER
ncbi:2-amino-4-hydroxy-6-hydroxymethyldihydropteridine diphosphokinase [Clostridioides mangenotii]|uniref:2-amino-4-hydroxy-6- hydroxymethyldihydropteridine diphosphokinase n=1 Tax=Metaclostridioides mangenotii TaxID=1540 RepID=UPI001C112455|nr:2-amino-4-hydroxy-6-hydroxymethyldihydropteridine diphosphokinase [Clostridioides mangenotii]MBU5306404.1 2-amino-4-hydroxy-6-hydroxymethyldihydropteridine diphosphokinase [Clostridioides mangenotii]MCR1953441.1 2-amino-4-hydroxy-6-hydroxymethyldihydropteridine diphosphokinase [Clostridioides mangenotii]